MTSETPIAVPPDKAPLRALGDLQGTLKLLRESFGTFWTLVDSASISEGQRHRDSRLIGQLIATAVQQAEALPKPDGDLGWWRKKAIEYRNTLFAMAYADGPEPVVEVEKDDLEAIGDLLTRIIGHLAAMPAQRPSCAKCGGRKAEHRYRMGDAPWCECGGGGCPCAGFVPEEGAGG